MLLATVITQEKSPPQITHKKSLPNSVASTSIEKLQPNLNQNKIEICDVSVITLQLKEFLSQRVAQGKSLESLIKSNHLSRAAEGYIFQASGLTYLQYLRYRAKRENDINDLLAVDNKPHILKPEISQRLNQLLLNSSASELGENIRQLGADSATIIDGKSIITKLLTDGKLSSETDFNQFIASSKLSPNFSDIVQAIRSHINSKIIITLASYYKGDLSKTWRESLVTNNLATYSARFGRPDLLEFWLTQGLPLSISDDNGKVINTILDMAASYRVPDRESLALLKMAEQNKVKPAGFHSYLFFNDLDIRSGHYYQRYLDEIKMDFMVNFNFMKLPDSVNVVMANIERLNQKISMLQDKKRECGFEIVEKSQGKYGSAREQSEQFYINIHKDSKLGAASPESYNFLVEAQGLLKSKKYDEFLLAVKHNNVQFGDVVVNQSVLLSINENAPFEVFKALFDMGGQLSPGSYALLASKNDTVLLKSFVEHNIKVTPSEHDVELIQQYNLDKTMKPETRRLLQQLGFTTYN